MAVATVRVAEGRTAPLDFLLKADAAAIDGTGLSVTLDLKDRHGQAVDTTGRADWLSQAAGTVRFTPLVGELTAARSPYQARWQVSSAGLDAVHFPNADYDLWIVTP